jgi:glutamine synthetase
MACEATFMAKPFADLAGSGMHLHVSVNDKAGKNIFASEKPEGEPVLAHAVGGMKALLGDSMAIYAPNANSYRRFKANSYAPVAPTWGVNNRTCLVPRAGRCAEHTPYRAPCRGRGRASGAGVGGAACCGAPWDHE